MSRSEINRVDLVYVAFPLFGNNKMHMHIQAQIQTVISVILHSRTNVVFEFETWITKYKDK